MSAGDDPRLERALAEPYAFVLLLWPAVIGLWLLSGTQGDGLYRWGLYTWLGISHLAAYGGGRGAGFGNLMLLLSLSVALACHSPPSPWTLAWLPVLLIGLLAAQRSRVQRLLDHKEGREGVPASENDPGGGTGADP